MVRVEIDKTNVVSLCDAQPSTNRHTKKIFLWLYNVYRRFIANFTCLAHPLNKHLKKRTPGTFQLDDEKKTAFRNLIDEVCLQRYWLYRNPTFLISLLRRQQLWHRFCIFLKTIWWRT